MTTDTRRSAVNWFADQMEETLRQHDQKKGYNGWLAMDCTLEDLKNKLIEEVSEVIAELSSPERDPHKVIRECADVGNIAMMIADKTDPTTKCAREDKVKLQMNDDKFFFTTRWPPERTDK